MSEKLRQKGSVKAALIMLFLLSLISLTAPLLSPGNYKEQQKNEAGEILSNLPPKIPALSFLGIAQGRRTLFDRRTEYLSDESRYPAGSIIEIKNRRISGSGTEYCDVVVDYYRYSGADGQKAYWLGTDSLGRDLWSRLWRGARISLLIALIAVALDMVIGVLYGALCGYYGGKTDLILMRVAEIIYAIPNIIMGTLFILLLGRGFGAMIVALSVRNWVGTAQLARAQFLRFKNREFVTAARAMGTGDKAILFRHILPNAMGPLITSAAMAVPGAIFMEALLSYIGLGLPAPEPSLGTLLSDAGNVLEAYPYQLFFPAAVISLIMLSFHFLANGLRETADPREIQKNKE